MQQFATSPIQSSTYQSELMTTYITIFRMYQEFSLCTALGVSTISFQPHSSSNSRYIYFQLSIKHVSNGLLMISLMYSSNNILGFWKNLHTAYVRKVVVMGIAPMGCAPHYLWRYRSKNGECIQDINNMIMEFNFVMRYMIQELNEELPDARIIFCDMYEGSMDIIENHEHYGNVSFFSDWSLIMIWSYCIVSDHMLLKVNTEWWRSKIWFDLCRARSYNWGMLWTRKVQGVDHVFVTWNGLQQCFNPHLVGSVSSNGCSERDIGR